MSESNVPFIFFSFLVTDVLFLHGKQACSCKIDHPETESEGGLKSFQILDGILFGWKLIAGYFKNYSNCSEIIFSNYFRLLHSVEISKAYDTRVLTGVLY